MAENEERLVVLLEARVNELEKGMNKAQRVANAAYREMKKGSRSATAQMEQDAKRSASRVNQAFATIGTKIGDYGKVFAGGFIGGIAAGGLTGVAAAVRGVAASFAELSIEAKTAGINVEDFQRWRYVADQNRIGVDALIDGFKELNLRADEYIQTGKGSAAESFQRLGMSPDEVKTRIKDPSAFMLELIDRTRRLKDTAAGIRIFDELLGGSGGEQFVRLIEQGRQGITNTLNEADKMGAVMDENFIKRAEEVDKKFNQIATTIGSTLKSAIVDAVGALSAFISSWNELNEKSTSGIKAELDILQKSKERWENQDSGDWQDSVAGVFGKDRQSQLAAINAEMKRYNDELERRKNLNVPVIPEAGPVAPYVPPEKPGKGGSKKSDADREREKAARAADREREAVKALIEDLQFEASLVGKSAIEKEKMIALRQAGAAATGEEKKQIEALVESTYRQTEAWNKSEAAMQELNDAGHEFAGTLVSGMLNGAKATDVLADAIGRLADRFLNSGLDALFGGGGFGGIFGGLFGGGSGFGTNYFPPIPKFAKGTNAAPGGLALVGERGPEIVNLPRNSQVVPNHMLGASGNGGGSNQNVNVTSDVRVSVDKDGNLKAFVQEQAAHVTKAGLDKFGESQAFTSYTTAAVRNAQKRGMLR